MNFLLAIALLVGVTIVPVMVGARIVGAKNAGSGSALLAVVALSAVSFGIDKLVTQPALAFALSAAAGAVLLAGILGTSFWRGLAVSVIVVAVQVIVVMVFAGALAGVAAVAA